MPLRFIFILIASILLSRVQAQNPEQEPTKKSEQEPSKKEEKKCIKRFKSVTDTYYGFPQIYSWIFRGIALVEGANGVAVKSVGPTGVNYQFMLTNSFGLGTDVNYSNVTVSYNLSNTDSAGHVISTYHYKLSAPAVRSMLSFNFHKIKPKWDWYASVKLGYYHRTIKFESDDPSFTPPSLGWPLPVAFRMEFGFRWFPIPFMGMHFNMGILGGALFNIGMCSKF